MGRQTAAKTGLDLEDHRFVADELAAIKGALTEVRDLVKEREGSASPLYGAVGRVLVSLRALRDLCTHEAAESHGAPGTARDVEGAS